MLRVFEENDGYFEDRIMMAYDGKHDDHWIGFKENVTGTPYIWWGKPCFPADSPLFIIPMIWKIVSWVIQCYSVWWGYMGILVKLSFVIGKFISIVD